MSIYICLYMSIYVYIYNFTYIFFHQTLPLWLFLLKPPRQAGADFSVWLSKLQGQWPSPGGHAEPLRLSAHAVATGRKVLGWV